MILMSDGLKAAADNALQRLLDAPLTNLSEETK
jgi:hypothetical protein